MIFYDRGGYDYVCTDAMASFPNGMDAEVFRFQDLEDQYRLSKQRWRGDFREIREHVTPGIRENKDLKRGKLYYIGEKLPEMRLTLDYAEDLVALRAVANALFAQNNHFGLQEIVDYMIENPQVCELNIQLEDLRANGTRQNPSKYGRKRRLTGHRGRKRDIS